MAPARVIVLLALLLGTAGCAGSSARGGPWPDAAGDVADPALAELCTELWDEILEGDPIAAASLGDTRFASRLSDLTPEGRRARRERLVLLTEQVEALDRDALSPSDRLTADLAAEEIASLLLVHDARLERWNVSPLGGPHLQLLNLAPDQPLRTPAERRRLIERWSAMPAWIDDHTRALLSGVSSGLVASHTAIERTAAQLDTLLARDPDSWALADLDTSGLSAQDRRHLLLQVRDIIEDGVAPALERYRDTLRLRLLPVARPDGAPGLATLPGGLELYARLVRLHTGLPFSAAELHALGEREVAALDDQMLALGGSLFGATDMAALRERLANDSSLHFSSRQEIEDYAQDCLERAEGAVPDWFGRLPEAACVVVPVPAHEEAETTIAYYRRPAVDGSMPGRYFVNTYAPTTRPRFQAEALAWHEAVPGHHFQIAIAQELPGLPLFRRHGGSTAFVEGWALYTERLADDMGLYSGDLDRLGMLSFEAWRACRLVVDTGLHALGWSREQAIDYMLAHTLLTRGNVVNEVDRYISNPGQALAYKVGQLEILALRTEARQGLGDSFDIGAFHDEVLGAGAVTMDVLRTRMRAWIAAQTGADASRNLVDTTSS